MFYSYRDSLLLNNGDLESNLLQAVGMWLVPQGQRNPLPPSSPSTTSDNQLQSNVYIITKSPILDNLNEVNQF